VSEHPDRYTHGHHESVLRSHRWRTVDNSAAYLVPHLFPSARVLDVGCGPGTITVDLARRVPEGHVTGIDRADDVIAAAAAEAHSAAVTNVSFATGDVYGLGFDDDSFDVVHAHQVLQHVADPVAALVEMRRVCRPGGVVAARDSDYSAMTWYPAVPELDRGLVMYCRLARSNEGEPDAGRRLTSWARAAGFTEVESSASAWCFAERADRAWWGGMWADRVEGSAFAEQCLGRGFATADDLASLAAGWRRWAADEDGWFAVLHGELVCTA
jgi:ubiquinone/menaquinone biosynthesis C-methylase UbiE